MFKSVSMIALLLAGVLMGLDPVGTSDRTARDDRAGPGRRGPGHRDARRRPAAASREQRRSDFTRVAAQTVRAVTNISSVQVVRRSASPFANDPFFQYFFGDRRDLFGRSRAQQSLGSGVVISADGFVVTNQHVIGESEAEVTVTIGDRREVRAKIIGVDSWTDLALLKIEATGLPVIPWGDSSKFRVAEWVMAVGNPFSLNQTVTLGIVSALGRANVGITQYEDFIQTDAAINPGNSGGALINGRGELIGINTAIFSQSGGYQGIGFAVPSNLVRRVDRRPDEVRPRPPRIDRLDRGDSADRAARGRTARAARRWHRRQSAASESAAYKAGLEPGDIILSFNGTADLRSLAVRQDGVRQRDRLDRARRGAARRAAARPSASRSRPSKNAECAAAKPRLRRLDAERRCRHRSAEALHPVFSLEAFAALALAAVVAMAIALLVGKLTRRLLRAIEGERFHTQVIANATVKAVQTRHVRPQHAGARVSGARSRRRRADRWSASRGCHALADTQRRAPPAARSCWRWRRTGSPHR